MAGVLGEHFIENSSVLQLFLQFFFFFFYLPPEAYRV
eukprot:COSAG05_NODE_15179_length_376_cov_1.043321_1_plen_36_part_01